MSNFGTLVRFAALSVGASALAGGLVGGSPAIDAAAGSLGASALQVTAAWILLRAHGAANDRFLIAFGRVAALRVFGSALMVAVVLSAKWFSPLAFLAGFGVAYLVLEIVADVLFVRNEKRLSLES